MLGDGPGIFPIRPFSLSRSAYEEQSRKGPRHNLDLSRKKWETPRFGNPRFKLASTNSWIGHRPIRTLKAKERTNNSKEFSERFSEVLPETWGAANGGLRDGGLRKSEDI